MDHPDQPSNLTIEQKNALGNFLNLSKFQICSEEELQAKEAEQKRLKQIEKANEMMKSSGFGERHLKKINPTGAEWVSKLSQIQAKIGSGFLVSLIGPRGTGKTLLGAFLARQSAFLGRSIKYKTAMGFFLDIKASFDGVKNERQVIDDYVAPKFLVLDELQERGETAWEDRLLTHVIDRRYAAEKDTLLITNHSKEDFLKSIGESVASRLVETGGIVNCTWGSYRTKTN